MQKINNICPYDVVIAHGPSCHDGAVAAWIIWRMLPSAYRDQLGQYGGFYSDIDEKNAIKLSNKPGSFTHPNSPWGGIALQNLGFSVVFVFIQPSMQIPHRLVSGRNVLILDLDLGSQLPHIVRISNKTLLCDHHDSSLKTLEDHQEELDAIEADYNSENPPGIGLNNKLRTVIDVDPKHSACSLVWQLLHRDEPVPEFIDIVRIGDTWSWHDNSKAKPLLESLYDVRAFRNFVSIEKMYYGFEEQKSKLLYDGSIILHHKNGLVNKAAKRCDLGYIVTNDGKVYTIAYTQASMLRSDICGSLRWVAEKRFKVPIDFCATWNYASNRGFVSVSLRDPAPGVDLTYIVRNVQGLNRDGGGHLKASSFKFYGIENFHSYIRKDAPESSPNQIKSGTCNKVKNTRPASKNSKVQTVRVGG